MKAKNDLIIWEEEFKFIFNTNPTLVTFYAQPKIYKNSHLVPCRPIVSGKVNLTHNISKYVDEMLAPFVKMLP